MTLLRIIRSTSRYIAAKQLQDVAERHTQWQLAAALLVKDHPHYFREFSSGAVARLWCRKAIATYANRYTHDAQQSPSNRPHVDPAFLATIIAQMPQSFADCNSQIDSTPPKRGVASSESILPLNPQSKPVKRTAVTYEPFGTPVTHVFHSRSKAIEFINCLIDNEIYFEVQFV